MCGSKAAQLSCAAPKKERKPRFAEEKSCPLTFVSNPIRPWRILILPYPRNGIPVPHRIKITVARKKLLAQRRRREGVYNRTAEASVTFPGGADTRERADSPRSGGWSIADFVSAKRNAGEFCFLCFITKEVPARHEGYKLAILEKVCLPGCAGSGYFPSIL